MEEYLKKLLEQVRFKKAHKSIEEEIRSHIEDQISDNNWSGRFSNPLANLHISISRHGL